MPLPLEVLSYIKEVLVSKNANKPCEACGSNDFNIAEDMFFHIMCIPSPMPGQVNLTPNRGMPAVACVCKNCGRISYHSCKQLGIVDEINKRCMELAKQYASAQAMGHTTSNAPQAPMVSYMNFQCNACGYYTPMLITEQKPQPECPKCKSKNINTTINNGNTGANMDPMAETFTMPPPTLRPITKTMWKKCESCDFLHRRHAPGACIVDADGKCACPPHRTHMCTAEKCRRDKK